MNNDRTAAIWGDWAQSFDVAKQGVLTLAHTRQVWDIFEHLLSQPGLYRDGQIEGYLVRTYASAVCSAIRLEADDRKDSRSLVRSLRFLVRHRTDFTREHYVAAFCNERPSSEQEAHAAFDAFAPRGAACVSRDLVEASLLEIVEVVKPVKRYTDELIAHRAPSMSLSTSMLSLSQINDAIDVLGNVVKQFNRLRTPGEALLQVTPVLRPSWPLMFQSPWLPHGNAMPELPERG